jgi:hypothetical protein
MRCEIAWFRFSFVMITMYSSANWLIIGTITIYISITNGEIRENLWKMIIRSSDWYWPSGTRAIFDSKWIN